jgi:hypothetical protein
LFFVSLNENRKQEPSLLRQPSWKHEKAFSIQSTLHSLHWSPHIFKSWNKILPITGYLSNASLRQLLEECLSPPVTFRHLKGLIQFSSHGCPCSLHLIPRASSTQAEEEGERPEPFCVAGLSQHQTVLNSVFSTSSSLLEGWLVQPRGCCF